MNISGQRPACSGTKCQRVGPLVSGPLTHWRVCFLYVKALLSTHTLFGCFSQSRSQIMKQLVSLLFSDGFDFAFVQNEPLKRILGAPIKCWLLNGSGALLQM